MVDMLTVFLLLCFIIGFGIDIFRSLSGKERFTLMKTIGYAVGCAALTSILLIVIIVLF
jgi:hypothetical protein